MYEGGSREAICDITSCHNAALLRLGVPSQRLTLNDILSTYIPKNPSETSVFAHPFQHLAFSTCHLVAVRSSHTAHRRPDGE